MSLATDSAAATAAVTMMTTMISSVATSSKRPYPDENRLVAGRRTRAKVKEDEAGQDIPGVVEPVSQHARGSAHERSGDLREGRETQCNSADDYGPDRILIAVVS